VDVIVPGVLEITRGYYGPIYNSAREYETNNNNPFGTIWNSENVYGSLSEYSHYVLALDGQVIDTATTSDDYSNYWQGSTYILKDYTFSKVWISNNQDNKQLNLLGEYYDNINSSYVISDESGLSKGNFYLQSNNKFLIVTEDSISEIEAINNNGSDIFKPIGVISYNVFVLSTFEVIFDLGSLFFTLNYYKTNGDFIGTKVITNDGGGGDFTGLRSSIYNSEEDGLFRVLLCNGDTIKDIAFNFNGIDYSINDYRWWY